MEFPQRPLFERKQETAERKAAKRGALIENGWIIPASL